MSNYKDREIVDNPKGVKCNYCTVVLSFQKSINLKACEMCREDDVRFEREKEEARQEARQGQIFQ